MSMLYLLIFRDLDSFAILFLSFVFVAFYRWFLVTFGTTNVGDSSGLDDSDILGRKIVSFCKIVQCHDGRRH